MYSAFNKSLHYLLLLLNCLLLCTTECRDFFILPWNYSDLYEMRQSSNESTHCLSVAPSVTCSYQKQCYVFVVVVVLLFLFRFSMRHRNIAIPCLLKRNVMSLFTKPNDFTFLDFGSWPKASPVQSSNVQPRTCTGFTIFPPEVRVVLLEYTAKAIIRAHFDHFICCYPYIQSEQESFNFIFLMALKKKKHMLLWLHTYRVFVIKH